MMTNKKKAARLIGSPHGFEVPAQIDVTIEIQARDIDDAEEKARHILRNLLRHPDVDEEIQVLRGDIIEHT